MMDVDTLSSPNWPLILEALQLTKTVSEIETIDILLRGPGSNVEGLVNSVYVRGKQLWEHPLLLVQQSSQNFGTPDRHLLA